MASNEHLQFVEQFEHFIFIQVNMNQRWCRDNTENIKDEAIYLKQLLEKELKSQKMKKRNVKKMVRKVNKWKMFHKIYGLRHKETIECFKKVIYYIERYEDLAQEDDDDYDDVSGNIDYEGYANDGYGDIDSYEDQTDDESRGHDNELVTEVLLDDMQNWLKDAKTIISKEIEPSNEKLLRGQIREIENLKQDLRARSVLLVHLLTGVQKLVGDRDVQSLKDVMEKAHQCLGLRLQQLLETLETFDDEEVVDESQMNVEDDLSSAKPKDAPEIPLRKTTVLNEKTKP